MHQSCVYPRADGYEALPGEFSGIAGVAVDRTGRVYIGDPGQNAVRAYTKNLTFLGSIGQPPVAPTGDEEEEVTESWLDTPVGVTVDHRGRIGVNDGRNARVAFYSVAYDEANYSNDAEGNSLAPPISRFEFQLDGTVSVEDFTMGLAEQCDPASLISSDPDAPLHAVRLPSATRTAVTCSTRRVATWPPIR
jgi:hypothetical protein